MERGRLGGNVGGAPPRPWPGRRLLGTLPAVAFPRPPVPMPRPARAVLLALVLTGCAGPARAPGPEAGTHPALEGVRIGDQVWSTRNLGVLRYRNGDPLVRASTREELVELGGRGEGAYLWVDGTPRTRAELGVFYTWYALVDPRGLVPEGWRLPTDADWDALARTLGTDSAGVRMKTPDGWIDDGGGTDDSGFHARAAGFHDWDGTRARGRYGSWWTASGYAPDDYYAWFRGVGADYPHLHRDHSTKYWGMSVRLVRDAP